jgi:hypothetical protein
MKKNKQEVVKVEECDTIRTIAYDRVIFYSHAYSLEIYKGWSYDAFENTLYITAEFTAYVPLHFKGRRQRTT